MDTIQDFREESSAMSRIYTWKTLWAVALDHPILGAGFGSDNPTLFAVYAPRDPEFAIFQGRFYVAHSIYLQALGEQGFVGLAIFLSIGFFTYRLAGRLAAETKDEPDFSAWVPLLMRMSQASLIGFAVGGAFLSLMHLDVPYYVLALVVLSNASVRETIKARRLEAANPSPTDVRPINRTAAS
jgi:probable O-glycosylation ligase (exosortase A-associated)